MRAVKMATRARVSQRERSRGAFRKADAVRDQVALYAVAVGVIPTFLGVFYEMRIYLQQPIGNYLVATAALVLGVVAWILSLLVLTLIDTTALIEKVVVAGLAAPGAMIFWRLSYVAWRTRPWAGS